MIPCIWSCAALAALDEFPTQGHRVDLDKKIQNKIAAAVASALLANNVDRLEALSSKLLDPLAVSPDGVHEIFFFTNAIADSVEDQVPADSTDQTTATFAVAKKAIESWQKKYPQSLSATVSLAELHESKAWKIRSGGWANTVTDDQMEQFLQELHLAASALDASKAASARNPVWYAIAESVGKGLNVDRSQYMQTVDEAIRRFPEVTYLAPAGVPYMTERWGGSDLAVRNYADHVVAEAKPADQDMVYGLLYGTLLVTGWYDPQTIVARFGVNLARLEKGYADWYQRYPQPFNRDIQAMAYCHAYDIPDAAPLMEEIGDSPFPDAWSQSHNPAFYNWCVENVHAYLRTLKH